MTTTRCTYRFSDGKPCTRASGHAPSHQYLAVEAAAPSEASTSLEEALARALGDTGLNDKDATRVAAHPAMRRYATGQTP